MKRTWVAFLRAVNVGGRSKVPMAELRAALADAGLEEVRTYIASGNVLFASDRARTALAGLIERALQDEFGVSSAVVLRTPKELQGVIAAHPFGTDTSKTYVTFLAAKPKAVDVRKLQALDVEPDRVVVSGSEVFVLHPNGAGKPRLSGAQLERTIGVPGTGRNWRTVAKLVELAGS
jgi:uncharacterized protein (DUF1697 family)